MKNKKLVKVSAVLAVFIVELVTIIFWNISHARHWKHTYYGNKNTNSGYELETEEQPCYYRYPDLTPRLGIFSLTSHVDCYKWYVPGFYTWTH